MRVARAVDCAPRNACEAALARLSTAMGKYWVCKRTPAFVNEAQECLGGIGYVEENPMPRYYRQAPLNSIWEGSGNVQCLDVLRTLTKEPQAKDALFAELHRHIGKNDDYDKHLTNLIKEYYTTTGLEIRSRYLTEQTALALQAAVLLDGTNHIISEAFCSSRLGRNHGVLFGTLPSTLPFDEIIRFSAN